MNARSKARELAEFQAEEEFHRREWRLQRIGWALLASILLAACLGLLGTGPLSKTTHASTGGSLQFERFARRHASTEWKFERTPGSSAGTFVVRIDSHLLQGYEITAIAPEPTVTAIGGPHTVFTFAAHGGGQIVFHVEPRHMGTSTGEVRLGTADPLVLQQFVYP